MTYCLPNKAHICSALHINISQPIKVWTFWVHKSWQRRTLLHCTLCTATTQTKEHDCMILHKCKDWMWLKMWQWCCLGVVPLKFSKMILDSTFELVVLLFVSVFCVLPVPGFGTQCFDFIFLNELTASELLYLSVQVTDVSHRDTHRESCSHTMHTLLFSLRGCWNNLLFISPAVERAGLENGRGSCYHVVRTSIWVCLDCAAEEGNKKFNYKLTSMKQL